MPRLSEFRLLTYEERSIIGTALELYRARYNVHGKEADTLQALQRRVSSTECQPGGCPFCNEERAKEEDERYD